MSMTDQADPTHYDFFIPAADYTDPDFGRRERLRLWPKVWQIACRAEEIPNFGDYVRYDIADESIVVVRLGNGSVGAYYNTCRHRGRLLVDDERGNVADGFACRYHGWRFALDGALTHVHYRKDWAGCPSLEDGSLNLKSLRVGQWAGWVWVSMDPQGPSLEEYLGEAIHVFRNFGLEDMRMAWYERLIVDVNWKVVIEAFNEGYHVATTHNTSTDFTPASRVRKGRRDTRTSTANGSRPRAWSIASTIRTPRSIGT